MKFCPYCGAPLVGSAVSFCAECGKPLPGQKDTGGQARRPGRKTAGKWVRPRKKKIQGKPAQRSQSAQQPLPEQRRKKDESYDGYYDDIRPVDAGQEKDRMDPQLMKRIALLVFCAVSLIILSAVLMWLL